MKRYVNKEMPREYMDIIENIRKMIASMRHNLDILKKQVRPGNEDGERMVKEEEERLEGMLEVYNMLPTTFWVSEDEEKVSVTFVTDD